MCQFVVPLVPSQEAHRPASSHARIGTGPTNTHKRTPPLLPHCGCRHCRVVCVHVCECSSTFLHFHRPHETNAEELGACERYSSLLHTWKIDHCLLQISVGGYLPYVTISFQLFLHMTVVETVDFFSSLSTVVTLMENSGED